ncbi:hypothetical protein Pcinc_000743 [Petrolisthes cinctipes]|uniref:UDP-glucuronosyltransferase n=1 Tax=Petrolisthes cinctipes TaxID=88211 RepID=A0AAE1GLJ0_PETCI|nr:hypothetical protein Pcinc_000743 [Petrolisthes cinctipes]
MLTWLAVVAMVLVGTGTWGRGGRGVLGELPPLQQPYNILVLMPLSVRSHRNVIQPIAEALAERGHKVVTLTKEPSTTTTTPQHHPKNLTEMVTHTSIHEADLNIFEVQQSPVRFLWQLGNNLTRLAGNVYNDSTVSELYMKRKEFDLIFVDALFHEAFYPFLHEVPFILVSTVTGIHHQSAAVGNLHHPAYTPTILWDFPRPWSLPNRLFNFMAHLSMPLIWSFLLKGGTQREISRQFPELPSLDEIERNRSLNFINNHPGLDMPLPLLPSEVPVAGIHLRPAKPLPKDLLGWVEGAGEAGVLYVSLGSMVRGSHMHPHFRTIFVRVFRRLQQRVIWKFEKEVPELSENVMVRRWLPQQDVLGHPNVKAFLSHGGLLSLQEAVYHATPLVAIPICCDHTRVAANIHNTGLGRWLAWDDLTEDLLLEAIHQVINNTRYTEEVQQASRRIQDQPQSARDVAVFWSEYVVRHRGAPHLRSPAADLSWIQFLLLDVLTVLTLTVTFLLLVTVWVWRWLSHRTGKIKLE